jgi:hypothetical protein
MVAYADDKEMEKGYKLSPFRHGIEQFHDTWNREQPWCKCMGT